MDWIIILQYVALVGGIATVLALLLAPMFYLGAKIDNFRAEMYKEMKDFHGRLERQDAEFKHGMLLLEEKMRNK